MQLRSIGGIMHVGEAARCRCSQGAFHPAVRDVYDSHINHPW
jgi:hypothetical protein